MADPRTIVWVSAGAPSAVAAHLVLREHPDAVLAYCHVGEEDADNARFLVDCAGWWGVPVTVLRSDEYETAEDVWIKRRYMSGIAGAPCTAEMKVGPRLAFQRPYDQHVFGYTANSNDVLRAAKLRANYPELRIETPLIEAGLTKAACIAMVERAGVRPPRVYAMGYPCANCIGCVKATSPDYWSLVRHHHPNVFDRRAALSRELGARLVRINGERSFLDELPIGQPMTKPIQPACDFLCAIAEDAT